MHPQIPVFNSSVSTITYTFIHFSTYGRWWKRSNHERTVHNETHILIGTLDKGKKFFFVVCLGNNVGRGPCAEEAITTLKTGNQLKNYLYCACWSNMVYYFPSSIL